MQGLTNRTLSEFLEPIDIYRGRMYWLGYIKYDKKEIYLDTKPLMKIFLIQKKEGYYM